MKNIAVLLAAGLVVALPFLFRRPSEASAWRPGDPVLVVVSPHNEAIRREFARGFSRWHEARHGRPVKVEWRAIGGTTEIMRYLESEYIAAFRAWWKREGRAWPGDGSRILLDRKFEPARTPDRLAGSEAGRREWEECKAAYRAFREIDDPAKFSIRVDVLFGGGTYDHGKVAQQGLLVKPWAAGGPPPDILRTAGGSVLLPEAAGGETWRTELYFGAALSTFGICYNLDRLRDLGVAEPPRRWADLADPVYIGQLGLADPTKSGSIAKAFEMIIHEQCHAAVRAAGYDDAAVAAFEKRIGEARLPPGEMPADVPPAYQTAVERGWLAGLELVRLIACNARYFTDSAGKVPLDVGTGNAAAGIAIDFYGRFQAESSRAPDGHARMAYVTPAGGSSVSADPISLLRGAEHRALAERFMEYVLGAEGQKLWNYAPGAPGGPTTFALRRLPARRDFYPSDDPDLQAAQREHARYTRDDLADSAVNPYALADRFVYIPRWTGGHFNVQRDLILAMCMDSGDELRAAWKAIVAHGGPAAQPEAMAALRRLPDGPEPLTWRSALDIGRRFDRLDIMREWTVFFRASYREAAARVVALPVASAAGGRGPAAAQEGGGG